MVQRVGRPSEKELWEGNETVLGGADHQRPSARRKHFLTRRTFSDVGINVGGHCDHYITSWLEVHQFGNLVSQAHQHILNAQIAGEESPGKTAYTGWLPSFSPDRAETVLSEKWNKESNGS